MERVGRMTGRTFPIVRHNLIAGFEGRGWVVINDMSDIHHGRHGVLMELVA